MEIGLLVIRIYRAKKGRMCEDCISNSFWTCTLTTLCLGWWGIISFFITPAVLIMNILSYRAVSLSPPYPAADIPPMLSDALRTQLEPYRDEIFQRLLKGEKMAQVSEDVGTRAGATAEEVR